MPALPLVDPTVAAIALAAAERLYRRSHPHAAGRGMRFAEHLRCYRLHLSADERRAVRDGTSVPLPIKRDSRDAEFVLCEILAFLEGARNQDRADRFRSALRLAFGSRAFERAVAGNARQAENRVRESVRVFTHSFGVAPASERGVYWAELDGAVVVKSVMGDGRVLTQRRVLPGEDPQDVIDTLWCELDSVSPDAPRLRLA